MLEFSKPPFGPLGARAVAFKDLFPESLFWTWIVSDWFFESSPPEGWEEVPSINDDAFLVLCSQLSPTLQRRTAQGSTTLQYFVQTADIHYAAQYPVMLCFKAAVTIPPRQPEDMTIGTHAVVLSGRSVHLYTLDQLGDAGVEIWQRVRQGTTLIPLRATLQGQGPDMEGLVQQNEVKHALWDKAQLAAKQLAELYWQFHQEAMIHPTIRTLPKTPYIVRSGGAFVTAPLAIQGVLGAYSNAQSGAKGWSSVEQKPVYVHKQEADVAQVELRPSSPTTTTGTTVESLWKQVRSFSDLDGDVLLAMLAQWLAAPRDKDGYTWITAEQILAYRGIQPRKQYESDGTVRPADYRQDDLGAIASSISHVRDTHVTLNQWVKEERIPGKRGRPKKRVLQQESYIVNIAEFIQQQELSLEGERGLGLEVAWLYRPGTFLDIFLEGPNRQVAWLFQKALSYDPYHETWEKRLARYFTFHMRMNAAHGGTTITRVLGEMINELSLPINRNDPEKNKKRFEKAMEQLQEDKQISSWEYKERTADLPPRKWLDIWLGYHVQISAAPIITEETTRIDIAKDKLDG